MTETPEGVVVTQADREAVCAVMIPGTVFETYREAIMRGNWDAWSPVQAFARHRLAHTPTLRGGEAELNADEAVNFLFNRLAKKLNLAEWIVVEGSEEWEGDVSATLHRLLVDAGIIDDETGAIAALPQPLALDTGPSGEADKASPRPWRIVPYGDGKSLVIHDARGDWRVCFMATPGDSAGAMERIDANAKLIVTAVNAFTTPGRSVSPDPAGKEAANVPKTIDFAAQRASEATGLAITVKRSNTDVASAAPLSFRIKAQAEDGRSFTTRTGMNRDECKEMLFVLSNVAALASFPTTKTFLREADLVEVLAWFSAQSRLSLYHYSPMYCDDEDQSVEWRVDRESGPINDREWDTIARGETAQEAILAAYVTASLER